MTNFWMYLISGRKRWCVYRAEDAFGLLGQDSADAISDAEPAERTATNPPMRSKDFVAFDPFRPDFERYPLARNATMFEAVLGEGELIFIPSGAPHAAVNLDATVALSVNYVDVSNAQTVYRHALQSCYEQYSGERLHHSQISADAVSQMLREGQGRSDMRDCRQVMAMAELRPVAQSRDKTWLEYKNMN